MLFVPREDRRRSDDNQPRLELPAEQGQPDSPQSGYQRQVLPVGQERRCRKIGLYQKDVLKEAHDYEQKRYPPERDRASASAPEHQGEERNGKLEHDNDDAQVAPAAGHPPQIPRDLVVEIANPDQHQLIKRGIGPEDQIRQEQASQILPEPP